jgi:uncharacterized protein
MRIAVIGGGISGMGAAYLLHRDHTVTLYEKAPKIGGHTRTLTINYDGVTIPVDTGFIVFNHKNYPNLVGLFKHLGVETQKSDMSFGISLDGGRLEWSAQTLASVFGQRSNFIKPSFYRMLLHMRRFFKEAPKVLEEEAIISLGELLDRLKLGKEFRDHFLLPMGGAIWSCTPEMMLAFPAQTFVRFFQNHGLLSVSDQPQWYTVTGGSQRYVEKITAPMQSSIKTGCASLRVRHLPDNTVEVEDSREEKAVYDHVILACHADEARAMLVDADDKERRILGAFSYTENVAYLHRDEALMPKRKSCWASWIYLKESAKGEHAIAVSYWMNNLQGIDKKYPLFVTLNPITPPRDDKMFDVHTFTHPVFTKEAIAAQKEMPTIQGKRNTWFCGAYHRYGFHEDGLMSAVGVAKQLGAKIPWE